MHGGAASCVRRISIVGAKRGPGYRLFGGSRRGLVRALKVATHTPLAIKKRAAAAGAVGWSIIDDVINIITHIDCSYSCRFFVLLHMLVT